MLVPSGTGRALYPAPHHRLLLHTWLRQRSPLLLHAVAVGWHWVFVQQRLRLRRRWSLPSCLLYPQQLPEGLQATADLTGHLQQLSYHLWSQGQCKLASPIVSSAVQLVADAACYVARQSKIKPDTLAHSVLLTEAYRAGEAGTTASSCTCRIQSLSLVISMLVAASNCGSAHSM